MVQRNRLEVCAYCDDVGGCDYAKKNRGIQPKLRHDFGGKDAVIIKPGIISVALIWCNPFKMAPTPDKIVGIQRAMCEGFDLGGVRYLTQRELDLIDNSKRAV